MEKNFVISRKNLPRRLPLTFMVVVYLFLKDYNVPGWVWGVLICLAVLILVSGMLIKWNEEDVDIFNSNEKTTETSEFKKRVKGKQEKK